MATAEEIQQEFEEPAETSKPVETEETTETAEVAEPQETQELTEIEQQAREQGWVPGRKDRNGLSLSAEEYLSRRPLFNRIDNLKAEINEQKEMLDAMKKHNETIAQRAYDRAVDDIKKQKKEAAEIGDTSRMLELDDEMDNLEKPEPIKTEPKEAKPEDNPQYALYQQAFEKFKSENDWYEKDDVMQAYADRIGYVYAQKQFDETGEVPPPNKVFKYTVERIAEKFPDYGKPAASKVATTTRRTSVKSTQKHALSELPEEDYEIARKLIRGGVMTEDDYLKDYFGE